LVSTIVQCLIIFAVVSIIWAIIGYSLVFGPSVNGLIGNFSYVGLNNVDVHSINIALAPDITELLFFAFQLKFTAITPALIIGLAARIVSNLVANWRAGRWKIDDSLDVFACQRVSGIWGSIATGLFASATINSVNGLFFGNAGQLVDQLLAVVVVELFAFFGSYLLLKTVTVFSPLRVTLQAEDAGLDLSEHGEKAYQLD